MNQRSATATASRGIGRVRVDRNTMPLFNLRLNTWYGWDGKSDNLWAQSIAPILDPRELGMTPEELQSRIAETPALANPYRNIFGAYVTAHDAETAMVNIAKALAAYRETLTSGRSAFDRFRDALAADDAAEIAAYPAAAQPRRKAFRGARALRFVSFRHQLHQWRVPRYQPAAFP